MKPDSEYPQQFTTVSEVELYARKLNEVSMRHKLEIESLKMHVKDLERILRQFETRYSSEQATYIVVSDVSWQEWRGSEKE